MNLTMNNHTQILLELIHFYGQYAAAVDAAQWDTWVDFFVEDCEYKIQPRENHERGFALSTLALLSKNMLKDRVYGIHETLYHDPYYQRHVVGLPVIREINNDVIVSEANYAVFRTKLSGESTVFNVGRYMDRIRREDGVLKFISRLCIYDSEMIPNSIIYPI
jgi:salicylate 5-hydroxylase small subunit